MLESVLTSRQIFQLCNSNKIITTNTTQYQLEVAYNKVLNDNFTDALSSNFTQYDDLFIHLSTACKLWKSHTNRKHFGCTTPMEPITSPTQTQ